MAFQQCTMQRSGFFGTGSSLMGTLRPQRASAPSNLVVYAGRIGPGKKWEHVDLTKNGKPVRVNMHIKSGDTVQVITGSDKGKIGKITKVDTKRGEVIVEGVNIKTKHVKPQDSGEEGGQIVKKEFPIDHSNVQLYSESAGVRSRVGHKEVDGKKVRYLIKTGEVIDN